MNMRAIENTIKTEKRVMSEGQFYIEKIRSGEIKTIPNELVLAKMQKMVDEFYQIEKDDEF